MSQGKVECAERNRADLLARHRTSHGRCLSEGPIELPVAVSADVTCRWKASTVIVNCPYNTSRALPRRWSDRHCGERDGKERLMDLSYSEEYEAFRREVQ